MSDCEIEKKQKVTLIMIFLAWAISGMNQLPQDSISL